MPDKKCKKKVKKVLTKVFNCDNIFRLAQEIKASDRTLKIKQRVRTRRRL